MYTDDRGYLRYKSNKRLVHRAVAYKEIYLPNKHRYKYSFSEYVIDHKDMNKKNNKASNLRIMLSDDHTDSHTDFNHKPKKTYSSSTFEKRLNKLKWKHLFAESELKNKRKVVRDYKKSSLRYMFSNYEFLIAYGVIVISQIALMTFSSPYLSNEQAFTIIKSIFLYSILFTYLFAVGLRQLALRFDIKLTPLKVIFILYFALIILSILRVISW